MLLVELVVGLGLYRCLGVAGLLVVSGGILRPAIVLGGIVDAPGPAVGVGVPNFHARDP